METDVSTKKQYPLIGVAVGIIFKSPIFYRGKLRAKGAGGGVMKYGA